MNEFDPGPRTANLTEALALLARRPWAYDALREVNGHASGYYKPEDYMIKVSLSAAQVAELSVEVRLEPAVQAQLEGNLSTYNELKQQAAMIAEAMDVEKAAMREVMEVNGVESLTSGNCTLRMVRGVTNSVDWKRLHADGIISEAQKENYTVTRPRKSYLDIRGAGEQE